MSPRNTEQRRLAAPVRSGITAIALMLAAFAPAAWGLVCNSNGTGNWNNNATWSCAATPGAADDVTINAGHTVLLNGANRQARNFTIVATGQLTNGNNTLTIQNNGVVQIDGVVQGNGASLFTKNGTGGLSGTGSFNNLQQVTINGNTTIATGSSLTFTGAECRLSIGAGDTVINDGTVTFNTPASCATASTLTLTATSVWTNNGTVTAGTVTGASGAIWTNAAGSTVSVRAAFLTTAGTVLNASGLNNTVNYSGTAGQVVKVPSANDYFHLTFSGSGNKDPVTASTYDILGNFTVGAGVTWRGSNAAADPAVNISGNVVNDGTFTTGNGAYTLGGNFTNNSTFTHTAAGTFTMNGTAAQAIGGTTAATFLTLTISNTSAAVTANTNFNVNTTLNMNGANTLLTPVAAVVVGGTGTLTGTGTVQVTRAAGSSDFVNQYTITTLTLTNLTVEYIGTATQEVSPLTYGSAGPNGGLKISNTSAAVTAAANFNVSGTLNMNGAATLLIPAAAVVINSAAVAGTITGTGTVQVTRTAATADYSSQYKFTTNTLANLTVEYAGGAAQTVSALTYGGLNINNANGVTLAGTATAGALLTLSNGIVSTGVNVLVASASCPGGVTRTSGHVAGNLRLSVPGGGASPTCVWYIGDASTYRPVTVAFTTVGTAGTVEAVISQAAGEHPNIGTSAFDSSLDVNRYWTLTNVTTAFTSAIATFTYLAGDVDAGADQLSFVVGRFAAGAWTYLTTLPAVGSAQATGLTSATLTGVFAAGEASIYSHWRMDQNSWNGTANEALDSGAGLNHGTASTCAFVGCAGSGSAPPKPTTSSVSPAVGTGGVSGTCSYGVFNRSDKDYVSLPGTYPDLMNAAGGFTITAWIKTTDNTLTGQRILLDDQNNTSPGGWGFSVGETATVGGLRFYYRQGTVFLLDTPAVPSNQWLFVAVSVKLAAGANASSASSYVYDTSGSLVTSATGTFTWTAGADPGPSSIGGETNAAGENTNAFGFSGNIDEVRVYRAPLGASQIDRVRQASRACATFNHVRIEHGGVGLTCTPATIAVKACFDASCTQLYNGNVAATLSPTGWVGGDGVVFSGSTAKDLSVTTAGTIALGTSAIAPAPTVATRCFNGGTETCLFEFKTSGFIFDVPDLSACKTSASVTITAVRADLTSQKCVPAFESGTRAVNFWSTYTNPATGTLQAEVNGTAVATSSPGTGVNLAFTTGAVSTFTVRYPDAGQMQLNARYTGSGTEAGLVMDGVDTFVSAPVGLAVIPTGGACAAGDATCAVYKKAGESFNHSVRAACWTVDGDTDFSDNPVTPNFQMAAIPLSAALVAPSGGNNASLGAATVTIGSGDNGAKTVSQSVSEVGVFTISVPAFSYLGVSIPSSTSPNIGRFTPDHFALTGVAATLTNRAVLACAPTASNFSHMGEGMDLVFSLRAENVANNVTQNYRTSGTPAQNFAKLSAASPGAYDFGARSGTTILTGRISSIYPGSAPTFVAGVLALTAANPVRISVGRNNSGAPPQDNPDGPYAATAFGIKPVDSDLVAMGGALDLDADAVAGFERKNLGVSTELRFGRLRLTNAVGSEKLALPVPMETQHWSGAGFIRNTDDSCTTFARSAITLDGYTPAAFAPGGGNCKTFVQQDPITFSSGRGTLTLAAPAGGAAGTLRLTPNLGGTVLPGSYCDNASSGEDTPTTAASLSYLFGRWNDAANPDSDANTAFDDNPGARASFGVYGAQPRNFIFFRENY